jgi:hypothetical protein
MKRSEIETALANYVKTLEEIKLVNSYYEKKVKRDNAVDAFIEELSIEVAYECEYCNDTGETDTDETDESGNVARGVGSQKCICRVHEEDVDEN